MAVRVLLWTANPVTAGTAPSASVSDTVSRVTWFIAVSEVPAATSSRCSAAVEKRTPVTVPTGSSRRMFRTTYATTQSGGEASLGRPNQPLTRARPGRAIPVDL